MTEVLGFDSGVFMVEFYWTNEGSGESNWHVVAVNCDQRRLFCNTLGVIPFAAGKKHESAVAHAEVCDDLKNPNECSASGAWREGRCEDDNQVCEGQFWREFCAHDGRRGSGTTVFTELMSEGSCGVAGCNDATLSRRQEHIRRRAVPAVHVWQPRHGANPARGGGLVQ